MILYKTCLLYKLLLLILLYQVTIAQPYQSEKSSNCKSSGQISGWTNINPKGELPFRTGGRIIPQLNLETVTENNRTVDFEGSLNAYGTLGIHRIDSSHTTGTIKPYRLWIRYSTNQLEIRAGLQKINFGSALLLRPLMWFDQVDARDPLQLTDGVWGLLGRYYFLSNHNIWLWVLHGNNKLKGWELLKTNPRYPEIGGRFQTPIPKGEAALTYHHRVIKDNSSPSRNISEHRLGFDTRIDILLGLWIEATWISKEIKLGQLTNQTMINTGLDYTFALGNGIYMIAEQLLYSQDKTAFDFSDAVSFSAMSLSYPVGLFDNLDYLTFFNWTNSKIYNILSWKRQFDKSTVYLLGYWNPENETLPNRETAHNPYTGKGAQILFVYNY